MLCLKHNTMEEKNKPLTRAEIKALKPRFQVILDKNGKESRKPLPAYEPEHPNNKQRRAIKQRRPHHNAKQTDGRKYQTVDITVKKETKFGPVDVPTGWTKKITHLIAEVYKI